MAITINCDRCGETIKSCDTVFVSAKNNIDCACDINAELCIKCGRELKRWLAGEEIANESYIN